jgi:hypothetical protein
MNYKRPYRLYAILISALGSVFRDGQSEANILINFQDYGSYLIDVFWVLDTSSA